MKRDIDLIRNILLKMESHEHGFAPRPLPIEGYSNEQIEHHVYLMDQAGLLKAIQTTHMQSNSPTALPTSLTWEGHEFLEAARKPAMWEAAKRKLTDAGTGWTIELLKLALFELGKRAIALPSI